MSGVSEQKAGLNLLSVRISEAMLQWSRLSTWECGCQWLLGRGGRYSACQTIAAHSSHKIYAIEEVHKALILRNVARLTSNPYLAGKQ